MMLPCIEAGSWNGAIVPIEGGYLADLGPALQVVLDTLEYGSAIKKTPVVVGNCTGFAVNRVFFPYTQAACLLVDLGLDPYKIDKAILGGFGMPMGPFRSALLQSPGLSSIPSPARQHGSLLVVATTDALKPCISLFAET